MPHKMTTNELLALLSAAEQDAIQFNSAFSDKNTRLLQDYYQEPYGDEVADRSQVVSPDVQDVVESDMPSLARVFLGSTQPVVFVPNTTNELEKQEVEEKNKYIHYLIMNQPWSYKTLFDWMKDAEIHKNGVVKYFACEEVKTEYQEFENVSEIELAAIENSLRDTDVQEIEVVSHNENPDTQEFDIEFKVIRKTIEYKIINVPPEQFLISENASSLDDAELVGDMVTKTRGELLAEGFDRELIDSLPSISIDSGRGSQLSTVRNKDQGEFTDNQDINDWASDKVEIRDLYVKIDYDGDGIAERRHIMKSGNRILINEPFDHVPYASLSCVPMPHRAIGRSRAELAQSVQRIKTAVLRQTLDNIYAVNTPRNVVHPDVNIDDVLTIRPNGVIRMKSKTEILPANAVQPLTTPYIGDRSLQIIQYLDNMRAQSTGTLMASQGLDADAIAKETATRFKGVQEDAQAKIELVARNFAEIGFRKLYEGMAWLVSQYQNSETEIRVLGKALTVDPTKWRMKHHVVSNVGLGSGNARDKVASLQAILGIQQQLQAQGSPMVDQVKLYNTLESIINGLGMKDASQFFNDPERPEQLLAAQNEILTAAVQQLQAQLQAQQNPLAEAEKIKAQADLVEAKAKQQMKAAELAEKARQFDVETTFKAQKHNEEMALELSELELKANKDVDGSLI